MSFMSKGPPPVIKDMKKSSLIKSSLLITPEGPEVNVSQQLPYIDSVTNFSLCKTTERRLLFTAVLCRDLLCNTAGKVNVLDLVTSLWKVK